MGTRAKTGGRTAGTPNRRTLATRQQVQLMVDPLAFLARVMNGETIDGQTPTLADRMAAARELRRVIVPDAREARIVLEVPNVTCSADLPHAMAAILAAVAGGQVTPGEGNALAGLLEATRKALETVELGRRIEALEAAL